MIWNFPIKIRRKMGVLEAEDGDQARHVDHDRGFCSGANIKLLIKFIQTITEHQCYKEQGCKKIKNFCFYFSKRKAVFLFNENYLLQRDRQFFFFSVVFHFFLTTGVTHLILSFKVVNQFMVSLVNYLLITKGHWQQLYCL